MQGTDSNWDGTLNVLGACPLGPWSSGNGPPPVGGCIERENPANIGYKYDSVHMSFNCSPESFSFLTTHLLGVNFTPTRGNKHFTLEVKLTPRGEDALFAPSKRVECVNLDKSTPGSQFHFEKKLAS
jgi:hypothetical protein